MDSDHPLGPSRALPRRSQLPLRRLRRRGQDLRPRGLPRDGPPIRPVDVRPGGQDVDAAALRAGAC